MEDFRVDDTLTIDGFEVEVNYETDDSAEHPWEANDEDLVRRDDRPHYGGGTGSGKKPHEHPLNAPRRGDSQFYYNWKKAMEKAKAEKWDTPPFGAPNQAERAVLANFKFYAGYLAFDWEYKVVSVRLKNYPQYGTTVGGFESHENYHEEGAQDLAREVINEYLNDIQANKLKKE